MIKEQKEIVIHDKINDLYFQCFVDEEILFSNEIESIRFFGTLNGANSIFEKLNKSNFKCYNSFDNSIIQNKELEIGTLKIQMIFEKC